MNSQRQIVAKTDRPNWVWWLNPAVAFSVPAVVAGLTAFSIDPSAYLRFWLTAKYFNSSCLALLVAVVIVFLCGCLLGGARRREGGRLPSTDWTVAVRWEWVGRLFATSFVLTVVAYGVWFGIGLKNGLNLGVILDIIHGASDANYFLREQYFPTIPGVTTGTQFGLAVIVLGVPLGVATGWRTVRWVLLTVFSLALVRAFLNSERLAVIELLVPLVISLIALRPAASRLLRLLIQCAPIIGAALLYVFFGAAEYFRSWVSYYANLESSFWSFIGIRLMGYYVTALNNGALLWKTNGQRPMRMMMTLGFATHFPILKDLIPVWAYSSSDASYLNLLTSAANPEFNNPSGIFAPVVDYGVAGGLLYWLLCGLVCGYLYKEFKRRSVVGVFLYPAVYISLIEATRVLYWADGRFFPGMFLLVLSVLFVLRKSEVPSPRIPFPAAESMAR